MVDKDITVVDVTRVEYRGIQLYVLAQVMHWSWQCNS